MTWTGNPTLPSWDSENFTPDRCSSESRRTTAPTHVLRHAASMCSVFVPVRTLTCSPLLMGWVYSRIARKGPLRNLSGSASSTGCQ